jgi:uncharacterized protein YndB with AHSA1/START domain
VKRDTVTERSAVHSSFTIERTYDATPSRVFAAFSDPEAKNRWFANGDGWGTEAYQLDFRAGGRETYRGHHADMEVTFDALYYDIVENERMVWAYDMTMNGDRISVSLSTIELRPDGEGTKLVFTEHVTFLDGHEQPGPREEGTKGLLEALAGELRDHELKTPISTDR